MSSGRTGFIIKVWPTRFWRIVSIRYTETYETENTRIPVDAVLKRYYFPSVFRAILYERRLEIGQYDRYNGSKYDTGFR